MNVDLGEPIAYGRTAEIYAWQEGWILKLFHNWFDLESIEYEARIARSIYASGLATPAVGEIIRVNGRNGLVYQRVEGNPMWPGLASTPWMVFHFARRTAALHVEIHASARQVNIPSQRQKLVSKIRHAEALPTYLRSKTLAMLDTMPDGDRLCHGDFHPGNIMVNEQSEIIIDWIDASYGNPLADVARTTILALGAASCQIQGSLQKAFVHIFHRAYLRHYFKLRPGGENEYNCWLPIVAAARLSENIPELEMWLIARTEKGLKIG